MLPAFLLTLREGLEIALILGIVLGALKKFERTDLYSSVWLGLLSATAASLVLAALIQGLGTSLEGYQEEIFEGVMMLLAAGMLTWMIFWMQRHARDLQRTLEGSVQQASLDSGTKAIFLLTAFAVLREGFELAVFLSAAVLASDVQQAGVGALLGLAAAALLGWGLFATTVRLNLRLFFQVTSVLLILFAAGLVAHGVHELNEAGLIPSVVEHVWDINSLLNEDSGLGSILTALFGYNGNPSLSEVIAYLGFFLAISWGLKENAMVPRIKQGV